MKENSPPRPMMPTMKKMKVGQKCHFGLQQWESLRHIASLIKRQQGGAKQFRVNRKNTTIVVTRIV